MVGRTGGSTASSSSQAVTEGGKEARGKNFKKPSEKISEARGKEIVGRNEFQEQEGSQQETSKEKEKGGSSRKMAPTKTTGVCTTKLSIIPWVILSDPAIQAHRDHMEEHVIICKSMGL